MFDQKVMFIKFKNIEFTLEIINNMLVSCWHDSKTMESKTRTKFLKNDI